MQVGLQTIALRYGVYKDEYTMEDMYSVDSRNMNTLWYVQYGK